jgi:hypothetical protein
LDFGASNHKRRRKKKYFSLGMMPHQSIAYQVIKVNPKLAYVVHQIRIKKVLFMYDVSLIAFQAIKVNPKFTYLP